MAQTRAAAAFDAFEPGALAATATQRRLGARR